jgi:hypothetical protein
MTSAYSLVIPASVKQGSKRAQSKRSLDSKFSELSELCASAVSASLLGDVRGL